MSLEVATGWVRQAGWVRLTRGLHVRGPEPTIAETLRAWQRVLPAAACFTHLTAATVLGWWLPERVLPQPLFIGLPTSVNRPRRPGVLPIRHSHPAEPLTVHGCRLMPPAEILLAAARDYSILDLVLLGDSALRLGHCTMASLEAVTNGGRRRGAPQLRRVIPLLDPRAESPWESISRVLHVAADIPVEPQYIVRSASGLFIARSDLRVQGTRRLHEYDGAVHRTREQHAADLRRDRLLLDEGWQRYGYTRPVLVQRGASIVRDTDHALGRPFDHRRVARWNALLADSTLTPRGRARISARWQPAFG